jgi:hypothetical protein
MKLAYVSTRGHGQTGTCLTEAAELLRLSGMSLQGTVTIPDPCIDPTCDMLLRILPDGPVMRINQNLGAGSKGCRLDTGALEEVVMQVALHGIGAKALIINKFGKLEAMGRGFVPLIAEALAAGTPVILGVNAINLPDLLAFAGDLAQELPPDPQIIADWALGQA